MKRLFALLLALVIGIWGFSTFSITSVRAQEMTKEQFSLLQQAGTIGKDVSYQDWLQWNEEARQLEPLLEQQHIDGISNITLQAGDILITNSTSSSGLVGHAAIALSDQRILHIPGTGEHVTILTPVQFKQKYKDGWIKVYRLQNAVAGQAAADWAEKTYADAKATYRITMNLTTTYETYCSKIVWQAYRYGVGKDCVWDGTYGFRTPYGLTYSIGWNGYTLEFIGEL